MSVQVFRLKDVPDDEAEEIRNLLTEHHIDHYETPPGNWGISMPAIWLHDEEQLDEAKRLIGEYQIQRSAKFRSNSGQRRSLLENPGQLILYIAFAAMILYFSIKPFLNFGQ